MTSMDPFFGDRSSARGTVGKKLRDPLPQLLAQISARVGADALFTRTSTRPWASALFEGRRHVIHLALTTPDARQRLEALVKELSEIEWSLTGCFVADICEDGREEDNGCITLHLSALTIEDW